MAIYAQGGVRADTETILGFYSPKNNQKRLTSTTEDSMYIQFTLNLKILFFIPWQCHAWLLLGGKVGPLPE